MKAFAETFKECVFYEFLLRATEGASIIFCAATFSSLATRACATRHLIKCNKSIESLRNMQSHMARASTWKEISFQKEIWAIGRKKEGNENLKEIGRKFDDEESNLKEM